MYIYNVTINIDESVHDPWLQWMRDTHIPDMLATGKFTEAKMCRVMVEEEMGGITYSVQYSCLSKDLLAQYYAEDAERLREDGMRRFEGKFVAFRTELELVSRQNAELLGATEFLFTYGTLQDDMIQAAVYSRRLSGSPDILRGYRVSDHKVAGAYPVIIETNLPEDAVEGVVYMVTNKELLKTDAYEGVAYKRLRATLESGKECWVYTGRSTEE
jgi:gamma-glutamylcyclotransferase (GGCT)/AIG2-like uncharacterized protein YtfP